MKGLVKTYGIIISISILLALVVGVSSQSSSLPQDGLINYWKLDGDAKDYGGNKDGVVTGAVPEANGLFGQAYKFDGDKDYIFLGNHTAEEDKYTVSAWFKTDSAIWQTIFHRGYSSTCFYNPKIDIQNGRVIVSESNCRADGIIGGRYYPGIPFKLGEWNHVTVTRDGNVAKVYLNGYLQITDFAQPGVPETLKKGDEKVVIGASRGKLKINNTNIYFENSFNGLIDDVAVWNRALTKQEVESIYKQAFPDAQPPPKLDIEYQQVETFPTDKSKFDDRYVGDSNWTVENGIWNVESGVLKNHYGGDIITMDSFESTPGKSIKIRVRQEGGNWKYSVIYVGRQDINNAYFVVIDPSSKNIFLRRIIDNVTDSIGLEVDFAYKKWYDVEFRWISQKELQVEVWDENGNSLGVLTRDRLFDYSGSENWNSGKFGLAGVKGAKITWFDDVRIGTIKGVIEPSPSPSPSPSPTESPTPTPSPPSSGNDFDLTITGDQEINEGQNAKFTVTGSPTGEEDSTVYFFNFDTAKSGLPTESKYDFVTVSSAGSKKISPVFTNAGAYMVGILAVGGLASDNPSGKNSTAQHTVIIKNIPPTANAGNDITINQDAKVPFNGGGSYAGDYDETFYYWDVDASDGLSFEPDKEKADLKGPAPQTPPNSYSYSTAGVYTATLRVFDDDGTFADDTVKVTVLEVNQLPSPTPTPSLPPQEVAQLKLPLKDNNLNVISKITNLDADFLLSVVQVLYNDLDKPDKKFLTDLPSEIVKRVIQLDAGVEDKLVQVFSQAIAKETDEKTQVDIVEAISLVKSQKTIDFLYVVLTDKLIGNCYSEAICTKAEQVALNIGDGTLLQLLNLINFIGETSQAEVFVESINICNNKESLCQTTQPSLGGYIVEAKIRNLGSTRDLHITTKIFDSVSNQLLVRSTKGDPEKIEIEPAESEWVALTDQDHLLNKNSGESVNVQLEIRDYFGYKNIITGSYDVGTKKDFEIPEKYEFTNYGISLINSEETLVDSNVVIPILSTDGSIYLESSSNNEISKNQIVSVGGGHGILLTDGSPASNNNRLASNKIAVIGKKSSALYIKGSHNITALNDILFSSNSSDINLERTKGIKLVNVTFRKDKSNFYQDNEVDVSNFLTITVKDSDSGEVLKDVSLKIINNKNKEEVIAEKIDSGQKSGLELVKRRIKSLKHLKAASSSDFYIEGTRLYFDNGDTDVEEEEFEYKVIADVPGYIQGSIIVAQDSADLIELTLTKQDQNQSPDPEDQIPPPPATVVSQQSPSSGGSGIGSIISSDYIKVSEKAVETVDLKFKPETIKLTAIEDILTDINQVITVENTQNTPLTLNFKVEGFNQLSLDLPQLDIDPKEEKQIKLSGKISGLKTGTYPGKIVVTSTSGTVNKEVPIILTINPPEHLFDLILDLGSKSSTVFAGDEILVNTKIVNVAGNKFVAKLKYGLKDLTNKILLEEDQVVSGEAITELIKKIKTNPEFESGNYIVEALLKDQNDNNIAVSALTVYINGKVISKQKGVDLPINIILSIIIVIAIAGFVVTKFVIKKK